MKADEIKLISCPVERFTFTDDIRKYNKLIAGVE